ncbi:MAG: YceI family protein [Acidimicrobiia bacterium]|nr:YceI family protein [Acidimicrobiia bacterium]
MSVSTTLQTVEMSTGDVGGRLDAEITPGGVVLAVVGPLCRVEVPVGSLHSGNALYDWEGRRRFDAEHYPLVSAELVTAVPLGAGVHHVTWRLAFHGAAHDVDGDLVARAVSADSIVVDGGNGFDVRDWGIQPGGFLGVRVRPTARFAVHLLARRPVKTEDATDGRRLLSAPSTEGERHLISEVRRT